MKPITPYLNEALEAFQELGLDTNLEKTRAMAGVYAKMQARVDRQLPELAERFLQLTYPSILRPTPPMGIIEFDATPACDDCFQLPSGTRLLNNNGIELITQWNCEVIPLSLNHVNSQWNGHETQITLQLSHNTGQCISSLSGKWLNIGIRGPYEKALAIHYALSQAYGDSSAKQMAFREHPRITQPQDHPFEPLVQMLNEQFHMLIMQLGPFSQEEIGSSCELHFRSPVRYTQLTQTQLSLNACPVVALQTDHAKPIKVHHRTTHYRVTPEAPNTEIYRIDWQQAWLPDDNQHIELTMQDSHIKYTESQNSPFPRWHISCPRLSETFPQKPILSMDLSVFRLDAHEQTCDGEAIHFHRNNPCNKATAKLITALSKASPPWHDKTWEFIRLLAMGWKPLNDAANLRECCQLLTRQGHPSIAKMIDSINSTPSDEWHQGIYINAIDTMISMNASEADYPRIQLFGHILHAVLNDLSPINLPQHLRINLLGTHEEMRWRKTP